MSKSQNRSIQFYPFILQNELNPLLFGSQND